MSCLICVCNAVRDSDIEEAVRDGVETFEALQGRLHVSGTCGGCRAEAEEVFASLLATVREASPRE